MNTTNNIRMTSQSPASNDIQYNVRDAALRGASLAFSKPPVKPKPQIPNYTGGNNGAFIAATKVGTGGTGSRTEGQGGPLKRDWTGGSYHALSPAQTGLKSSSSSMLEVPLDQSDRTPSPSNIAAKLAAARFSPMKPKSDVTSSPRYVERDDVAQDILPPAGSVGNAMARLNVGPKPQLKGQPSAGGRSIKVTGPDHADDDFKPTDETSIPPTTSLVQIFEKSHLKSQPSPRSRSIKVTGQKPNADVFKPTDETPIPPTTSLVRMFEKNRPTTPPMKRTTVQVVERVPTPLRSPTPRRPVRLSLDDPRAFDFGFDEKTMDHTQPYLGPRPPASQPTSNQPKKAPQAEVPRKPTPPAPPIKKPAQSPVAKPKVTPPKPPSRKATRRKSLDQPVPVYQQNKFSKSSDDIDRASSPSNSSYESAPETQEEAPHQKPKPDLPPPRRSTKKRPTSAPRLDSKMDPALPLPPRPKTPSRRTTSMSPPEKSRTPGPTSPGESIYHKNYQRTSIQQISKHLTGSSLSHAIVGAALASSRTASPHAPINPSLSPPPLPHKPHHHHHHHLPFKRSPSPKKPDKPKYDGKLRTTLRKESESSTEDEGERYKRKGTRVLGMGRKHPNKHHEGARKRWRDTVTERERKRYEGVWAANKGLYISVFPNQPHSHSQNNNHQQQRRPDSEPSPSPSRSPGLDDPENDILNLVVCDLWSRSRLPAHVLEEIWDLVDGRGVGRLRREEFVVGMWLVDQRLKGRKLPVRVGESVWGSVRMAGGGVKVRVPNGRGGKGKL